MRLKDLLRSKGGRLFTIRDDAALTAALELMCRERIGALPVVDAEGRLVGIVSERDMLFLYRDAVDPDNTRVQEVMTREVIVGLPSDSVNAAMHTMTERRIRHLPILEDGELVGMVSIGDIVKALREEAEEELRYLRDYLAGSY